jgi:hypothetical protein
MKRLLPFLFLLTLSCVALAQSQSTSTDSTSTTTQSVTTPQTNAPSAITETTSSGEQRMFFPKGWYWGWAEFDLAPPHNELDPNLCAVNAGQFGGVNSKCNAFARYVLSGALELRPFGRTFLKNVMVFFDPNFLFGKNVPQTLYTWSWDAIGMESTYGAGYDLPKRFQIRFTAHPNIARFGSRDQNLGPAYLGPTGPWGQYNAIGVRKYFGTKPKDY